MVINWEEFKAMIKVNFLLQILIFLGYFIFVDYYSEDFWWYYVDSGLIFFYLIFTRMAAVAVYNIL